MNVNELKLLYNFFFGAIEQFVRYLKHSKAEVFGQESEHGPGVF
jgi:hypothetical protein